MNNIVKAFVISVLPLVSVSSFAKVNVDVHKDISTLVINGEGVGFSLFKNSNISVDNGLNQLAVRVEKLVISDTSGEKEKFNSQPIVLTFEGKDVDLELSYSGKLIRTSHAEQFDKKPQFVLTDISSGKPVSFKQSLLPNGGGITRDYEQEIKKYNYAENISLTAGVMTESSKPIANIVEESTPAKSMITNHEMIQYWFTKAKLSDREAFIDLAFKNRKSEIKFVQGAETRELDMLVYWYNQADVDEKKSIISWLLDVE